MDRYLLEIIACPICKGELDYRKDSSELLCRLDRLAFPVRDGVPVLLEDQARDMEPGESGE